MAKSVYLLDKTISVPNELKIPEGSTLTREDFPKEFRFLINTKTMTMARKIVTQLMISRKLPIHLESVTMADPVAMLIMSKNPEISGSEAVELAKGHYESFIQDANTNGFIIAFTALNKLPNSPTPYTKDDDDLLTEGWGEEETPDWIEEVDEIPEPIRDLRNPYERRFKQIMDFLEMAGVLFVAQFNQVMNDGLAEAMREIMGEATDTAGFQSKSTGGDVPASVIPISGNNRNRSKNSTKAESVSADSGEVRETT